MSSVAYTDLELPEYQPHHVFSVPSTPCKSVSSISVRDYPKVISPGDLMLGTIEVAPKVPIGFSTILVKLVLMERATNTGKFTSTSQSKDRIERYLLSTIPTKPMQPGFTYTYPFLAEVPHSSDHPTCPCGSGHSEFPATIGNGYERGDSSHGASVRYVLSVTIAGTELYCLKVLTMEPREPLMMNYDGYTGACELPIERLYTSSTRIYCRKIAGKLIGYLLLTGSSVVCDPLGFTNFRLGFETTTIAGDGPLPENVKSVRFALYRVVYASLSEIQHHLAASESTAETKIKLCEGSAIYQLGKDEVGGILDISAQLPPVAQLMPPPFVSCYVAVKYELQIQVEHHGTTGSIMLPLNFGGSAAAPEYTPRA